MRAFGNLLIILSAIIPILFGLEYFSEATIVFVAFLLYLTGHYVRHNFTYRNFKISRRSKPFFESILKNTIQAFAYVTIFIFVGYILLKISKSSFKPTLWMRYFTSWLVRLKGVNKFDQNTNKSVKHEIILSIYHQSRVSSLARIS